MSANEYHFVTHWRVHSTRETVYDLLADAPDLARWWHTVYLAVEEVTPGDRNGVGKVVRLHTKGWLPYRLRWQFWVTDAAFPTGYTLEAWGDFVGRGVWTFVQKGEEVRLTYDWRIRADKPLLRYLSFLLKPIFAANHRWAMAQGEVSLQRELARRQSPAATPTAHKHG